MDTISDYIVTIRHAEGTCVFSKRRFKEASLIFRDWCDMAGSDNDNEFNLSMFSKNSVLKIFEWFECLATKNHLSTTEAVEILKIANFLQMFTNEDKNVCLRYFELSDYIMDECGIHYGDYPNFDTYNFYTLISILENEDTLISILENEDNISCVSKSKIGKSCSLHNVSY